MRIMIAGTGSGCGKTTASLLLMAALRQSGLSVAPCKTGPDYIDPGFHALICGMPSHNLDSHLIESRELLPLCADRGADITVIEGVMGYYDGMDAVSCRASTWEMAKMTDTPVLLVADASGAAASVAATVYGFRTLKEESRIAGVLVNRVSGEHHYRLVRDAIAHYTGLPCVGYIRRDAAPRLESRHLGLVQAGEIEGIRDRIEEAARSIKDTLDIPEILKIASTARPHAAGVYRGTRRDGYRMGIAMDKAFSFYYEANLEMLRALGMTLVPFSPIKDKHLPPALDGLYIGGGYPEVFARELQENQTMRMEIVQTLESGMPCYAECGGMMYLSRSIDGAQMVGYLPQRCMMTKRLQRFGYVWVTDSEGRRYPAHEFHHAVVQEEEEMERIFTVQKASDPQKNWPGAVRCGRTTAGFAHLHFASHPELIDKLWPV